MQIAHGEKAGLNPLEDDGGEVVHLLCAARKTQNILMEDGNNFDGGFFACRADGLAEPLVPELLFVGIFPFKEAVGGQKQHVAGREFEAVWRVD